MLKMKLKHNPYDPLDNEELRLRRIRLFEEVMTKHAQIREMSDESGDSDTYGKNNKIYKKKYREHVKKATPKIKFINVEI